jgi:hypothetical protein
LNKTNLDLSDSQNENNLSKANLILENHNDGILNVDTERLYNEYCKNSFSENTLNKYENLYNDFKIILKITESLKNEYKTKDKDIVTSPVVSKRDTDINLNKKNNLLDL